MKSLEIKYKSMTKIFFIQFILAIVPIILIGQNTDTLLVCCSDTGYYGFAPEIYLYKNSDTIKIVDNEYPIVFNLFIQGEFPFSEDSISIENSVKNIVGSYDEKILISNFEDIELDTSSIILYSKQVDFIGDTLIDKIEIVINNTDYLSYSVYQLRLYENRNGIHYLHELCGGRIGSMPLKIYVSKTKHLDMAAIFVTHKDEFDDTPYKIQIYRADYLLPTSKKE